MYICTYVSLLQLYITYNVSLLIYLFTSVIKVLAVQEYKALSFICQIYSQTGRHLLLPLSRDRFNFLSLFLQYSITYGYSGNGNIDRSFMLILRYVF